MKKAINITGYITTFLAVLGGIFKTLHWPGAGIGLVSGLSLFSCVYLPMVMINKLKSTPKGNRLSILTGHLSMSIFILGTLFKIQHWPGGGIMFVVSCGFFCLVFLPVYLISKLKSIEDKTLKAMYIFGTLSAFFFILGLLFRFQHWPFHFIGYMAGVGFLFFLFIPYSIKYYSQQNETSIGSVAQLLLIIMTGSIVFNFAFAGVSKDILNSFIFVDKRFGNQISTLDIKKSDLLASVNSIAATNKSVNGKVEKAKKLTDDFNNYVLDLKAHLISQVDKLPSQVADTISFENVDGKDNYDIPTYILIDNPDNPREGKYSAKELKNKVNVLRADLTSLLNESSKVKMEKRIGLKTPDFGTYDDFVETWELGNFYHMPLAAVFSVLTSLQADARYAEAEILNELVVESQKE